MFLYFLNYVFWFDTSNVSYRKKIFFSHIRNKFTARKLSPQWAKVTNFINDYLCSSKEVTLSKSTSVTHTQRAFTDVFHIFDPLTKSVAFKSYQAWVKNRIVSDKDVLRVLKATGSSWMRPSPLLLSSLLFLTQFAAWYSDALSW